MALGEVNGDLVIVSGVRPRAATVRFPTEHGIVHHEVSPVVTAALAAEVCTLCDDERQAVRLDELLLPFEQHCVVVGHGFGCLGSVAYFLGQLR